MWWGVHAAGAAVPRAPDDLAAEQLALARTIAARWLRGRPAGRELTIDSAGRHATIGSRRVVQPALRASGASSRQDLELGSSEAGSRS